ncbi:MAG: ABC transporter permease, partial [Methylocystaceae bacterium]
GDYPQKDQLSDAFVRGELKQLKSQTRMLPTIFLLIAAAVQYVMLGRMIKAQRMQIGIMKALGYTSSQIIRHYTGYAVAIGVLGAVLGSIFGIWLAGAFSSLYAEYFNFPRAIGGVNYTAIVKGVVLSLSVAALSGIISTRGVLRINPAEALRPEPPQQGHAVWLEKWPRLWQKLNSAWKMSLRAIGRNRRRFLVTLLGVICSTGLLVTSIFLKDTMDYMRQRAFFNEQRYDIMVRFKQPQDQRVLYDIIRLPGVIKSEPVMEVPVKIRVRGKTRQEVIQGLPEGVTLRHIAGTKGQPLGVPGTGILVSNQTANKLDIQVGDQVTVETMLGYGPKRTARVLVMGVNQQIAGSTAFASLQTVNQILRERNLVTGVMLKTDPQYLDQVQRELASINGITSVVSRQKDLSNFDKNLETMDVSLYIMVGFALLLGFAIIYNSSVISFAERQRELATLRVIGLSVKEVAGLLRKEVLLYGLLGALFGLPVGRMMAIGLAKAASTDLYQFEAIIYPSTYLWAAVMTGVFITVGHLLGVRGIKKLDLVEVLKNRD